MLILRRRLGESIIISGNIKVTILAVDSGKVVKVGIEAPEDINVAREEVARDGNHRRGFIKTDQR